MTYLDSCVFLTAVLNTGGAGETARGVLLDVQEGRVDGLTSTLTYDEVYWSVKKHRGRDDALLAAKTLVVFPNLGLVDVTADVIWKAHELLEEYPLDPRDAIHAACAISKGTVEIMSDDQDFDRINVIKRIPIAGFK